jgi:hypothetical protein
VLLVALRVGLLFVDDEDSDHVTAPFDSREPSV